LVLDRKIGLPCFPDHRKGLSTDISLLEVERSPFVGLLVPNLAIEKIGLPRKDFFIKFDDFEYCERLRENNYRIYLCTRSVIYHPKNNAKKFFGISFPTYSSNIFYYWFRNGLYVKLRYRSRYRFFLLSFPQITIKALLWLLFSKIDNLQIRVRILMRAFLHGLKYYQTNRKFR